MIFPNFFGQGDTLDDLDCPPLEARRKKSSIAFFHKIHMVTVSIDKDTYLIPHRYYGKLGHQTIYSIIGTLHTLMPWKTFYS